jgi:hypothetical protein
LFQKGGAMGQISLGQILVDLKNRIEPLFTEAEWVEIGFLTDCDDIIDGHSRLLRSYRFQDTDYPACILEVLRAIVHRADANLKIIADYVTRKESTDGEDIRSHKEPGRKVVFAPQVFKLPPDGVDRTLISAMMPFNKTFDGVYESLRNAAKGVGCACERADNIWNDSTVIQDIFSLIFRSNIVVCDFSGKNPNVFYEAGIAHTLGRHVIPITQSADDIPFDLRHHRYIQYLNNGEGRDALKTSIEKRFDTLLKPS